MAEIGYCIGRPWWNRGITSEALSAVINFMFDQVGANRVQAKHDVNNPHSGLVMKKCGMKYEGTLRSAAVNNQGVCDVSMRLRCEHLCIIKVRSIVSAASVSPKGETGAALSYWQYLYMLSCQVRCQGVVAER